MRVWGNLIFGRLLALLAALALVAGGTARAQADPPPLKPEEIEALVAPIALYPDDLLAQVLMASTYPLEVVQAARWVKANPNVKGEAAVKAVGDQPWDVTVKGLVAFPQVLEPMDQKIDWTQKLGDAFLADQKAVLDAVQRLRTKAQASGNLKTTEQQKVVVEQQAQQQVIIIEPAQPNVIYVPAYNPTVVYGPWIYPAYPPYYWPPPAAYYPGGYFGAGLAWGLGVAAGAAIIGGANWGGGDVNINVNKAANIDRSFNRNSVGGGGQWKHDTAHRGGVSYRDNATRQKVGRDVGGASTRQDYRGRDGAGDRSADRAGERPGGGADRAGDRGGADRAGDRGGAADRGPSAADRGGGVDRGGARDNAFSGVNNPSASQRDLNRGQASNASMGSHGGGFSGGGGAASRPSAAPASRPSPSARPSTGGGGARGGGGGGGGGRGGGRR